MGTDPTKSLREVQDEVQSDQMVLIWFIYHGLLWFIMWFLAVHYVVYKRSTEYISFDTGLYYASFWFTGLETMKWNPK